jgi:hypothetical protein
VAVFFEGGRTGCAHEGAIVAYEGDDTIVTDCSDETGRLDFATVPGASANQVVFVPSRPVLIPANTMVWCSLEFGVRILARSDDETPAAIEQIAGFDVETNDAECDNRLMSSDAQSGAIILCPDCEDGDPCTIETCDQDTGVCKTEPSTDPACLPSVCGDGAAGPCVVTVDSPPGTFNSVQAAVDAAKSEGLTPADLTSTLRGDHQLGEEVIKIRRSHDIVIRFLNVVDGGAETGLEIRKGSANVVHCNCVTRNHDGIEVDRTTEENGDDGIEMLDSDTELNLITMNLGAGQCP